MIKLQPLIESQSGVAPSEPGLYVLGKNGRLMQMADLFYDIYLFIFLLAHEKMCHV